jgi:ABC-2 type transport system permease protein
MITLCWVELRKLRHDRTELYTRAIQPALWLLIFGETFNRIHAISTPDGIPYLAYLAPGILAQSALFVAIFYGIQIIWERDAGVLAKLMVTPTPRAALITGKAFAAGLRSVVQAAWSWCWPPSSASSSRTTRSSCWPPPASWYWARRSSPACPCPSPGSR